MYQGKTRYQDNRVADDYDRRRFTGFKGQWTDAREKHCLQKMLSRVPAGSMVLDIPCGTGRMTELLADLGMTVTAADISDSMMNHAKARSARTHSQVRFVKADIENLEFSDASFEAIATIRLLHHMPSSVRARVLSELHRVSRKWVAVTFGNKYTLQSIRRDVIAKFTGEHRYSISPQVFRREAENAGFRVVEYIPLLPIISESVFVLLEKA